MTTTRARPKTPPDRLLEIVFVEDLKPPRARKAPAAAQRKPARTRAAAAKKQLARPRKAGSGERGRGKKASR